MPVTETFTRYDISRAALVNPIRYFSAKGFTRCPMASYVAYL